ncbi:hypothetical protein [Szabonella alba]|uniref:Anti-sigma factor n=1 Tax=Szabonella alba TaxID=2804194 RepID=A0A8K0VAK5_9RHOB|nr:hypothetical protein [Szabonella alba]MBL4916385.1 hypothetical protein [Szabonella alba]
MTGQPMTGQATTGQATTGQAMTGTSGPGGTGPEEVTDDMLMALADDELSGETATALRRRIAADPELTARLALFETGAADLRAAFAAGPVPERLLRSVMDSPMAQSAEEGGSNVTPLPRRRSPLTGAVPMALAASVVLALAVGFLTGRSLGPTTPTAMATATPEAAARALATLPTGGEAALEGGATARVLASFQTDQGLCRMIAISAGRQEDRAVICGAGADWSVALSVQAGGSGDFVTASDTAAEMIDAYLDRIGAGAPLTPAEEEAALAP